MQATFVPILLIVLGLAFSSCQSTGETSSTPEAASAPDSVYLAKGQQIAASTFQSLSGQLQQAMKAGGVQEAVSVCQLAANPIVDSLSQVHQAEIRRTALRVRNPKNAANDAEQAILQDYQSALEEKTAPKPKLVDLGNGQVAFYAPIIAADLCLKCHGIVGETIQEQDYAHIQALYPEDQAIGFQAGDLRGIWSIRMANSTVSD